MDHRITFEIIYLRPSFVSRFTQLAHECVPYPDIIPENLIKFTEGKRITTHVSNYDVYLKLEELYSIARDGDRPSPSDVCEYENPAKSLERFNVLVYKLIEKDREHLHGCVTCGIIYHIIQKIFIHSLMNGTNFGFQFMSALGQMEKLFKKTPDHKFTFSYN